MLRASAAAVLIAILLNGPESALAVTFKHIIVVIQENRTPDNLFGSNPTFEPGVDISTAAVTSAGAKVRLGSVALNNCYDIAHTHAAFVAASTKGFDTEPFSAATNCHVPANPQFKYVDNSTGLLNPYFDLALQNGFANRMFQTNQGPSFPAHQFLFGGTSAPTANSPLFAAENTADHNGAGCAAGPKALVTLIDPLGSETSQKRIFPCFEHQTLADLLDAASPPIGWRYYSSGTNSIWTAPNAIRHICGPTTYGTGLLCTGTDWVNDVVADNPAQVLTDITECSLQPVSWVVPTLEESDHASVNNGTGPAWVASIVNAIGNQSCGRERYWNDTAIFVVWDDWGGWYDHVKPLKIVTPYNWGAGYTYGFRVPLIAISAYTQPGQVSNSIFDFGSILAFIEHNFGLGFIGPGLGTYTQYADYQASLAGRGNLAEFFKLDTPKVFTPIPSPLGAKYFLTAPTSGGDVDD